MSTDNYNVERIHRAEQEIREAARRIDPYTARMIWWYAQTLDPYGIEPDLPEEYQQVGREYFLEDPEGKWAVLVQDVRKLHPEISDGEWEKLMRAAARRDTSPDPFPMFHLYSTAEERREAWTRFESREVEGLDE
jgi:hypothetical protein